MHSSMLMTIIILIIPSPSFISLVIIESEFYIVAGCICNNNHAHYWILILHPALAISGGKLCIVVCW